MLAGKTDKLQVLHSQVSTHHVTVTSTSGDDILRQFWEIEESPKAASNLSPQVIRHFDETHTLNEDGRFVVLTPNPLESPECK